MEKQRHMDIAAVRIARIAKAGAASIMLLAGAFALSGCEKKKDPAAAGPPPALPVTVVKVQPTDVPLTNEWVGTLDGYVNAQIQPQASGYLIRQDYREGSQVARGQVLFEIDPRPLQAALEQAKGQLEQAKGQVAQAQAQLGLAQINVNRDTPLAEARAIAQSTLDNDKQQKAQQEASVESAQASVKSAEANVATAKLNLSFTQVRSLIAGVAGQATTQVGNLVSQQTVLTSVSQLNPIKVYFSIGDSEYLALTHRASVGNGSDLLRGAANVPLTLTLSNGDVYPSKGRIAFIDRQVNAQTGAIRIAASFPNPGNVLRPGQFGRVKAETEIRHNAMLVPQSAVQDLQGQQQVYLAGQDGKVHLATVKLGAQVGPNWVVESGIPPGALIITDNIQKLREGSPVQPHEGPAAPPAGAPGPSAGR